MGFIGKIIGVVQIAGAIVVTGVIVIALVYDALTGQGGTEPTHGYTAVCKDGTVLSPPDNECGPQHGYLDHWTNP